MTSRATASAALAALLGPALLAATRGNSGLALIAALRAVHAVAAALYVGGLLALVAYAGDLHRLPQATRRCPWSHADPRTTAGYAAYVQEQAAEMVAAL